MDTQIQSLISLLGLEKDETTWRDITGNLFNGVTLDSLHLIHENRNKAIEELFDREAAEGARVYRQGENPLASFREARGGLQAIEPVLIVKFISPEHGIRITKPTYLGKGVLLVDSTIDAPSYIADGARVLRTHIIPGNSSMGSVYVGRNATLEELDQCLNAVIGSAIGNPSSGYEHTYYHGDALNNAIVGGSTAVSDGVSCQSHITAPGPTYIREPVPPYALQELGQKGRKAPLLIGSDCIIGDGAHLVAPSIIGEGSIIQSQDGNRPVVNGLYLSATERYEYS